ncbi:hypothetical protein [Methanomicrobium sp. W14]|uniref:hypothetical protein n=1 Tax=Methanomicrobium sp. W14 TaxID=2817839 RepID=UPI001AE9DC24|nr:hypothetical protein [Methanomicrobium sp. W14]
MIEITFMIEPEEKHIHIMAAGASIEETYRHIVMNIKSPYGKPIDITYVLIESDVLKNNNDPKKIRIKQAYDNVRILSDQYKIEYYPAEFDKLDINSIRNAIADIKLKYPNAYFSFNITGGTKIHTIGLLLMSIWLIGDAYYVSEDSEIQKISIPKMYVEDVSSNPNYISILKILSGKKEGELRKSLESKMRELYRPVRNTGDKKTDRVMHGGTLTKMTEVLENWELIQETEVFKTSMKGKQKRSVKSVNKKEKRFIITENGELALKFALANNK